MIGLYVPVIHIVKLLVIFNAVFIERLVYVHILFEVVVLGRNAAGSVHALAAVDPVHRAPAEHVYLFDGIVIERQSVIFVLQQNGSLLHDARRHLLSRAARQLHGLFVDYRRCEQRVYFALIAERDAVAHGNAHHDDDYEHEIDDQFCYFVHRLPPCYILQGDNKASPARIIMTQHFKKC